MKLSKRLSKRLAFVASELALSIDQDERMALLGELLDELGIDAEQRADSKESAARHLRYTAQQRRKAAKKADDTDRMNLDELQASNKEMLAKLKRLLEERRAEQQPAPTPEPAPTVEEAPQYDLPTRRMEKAVARFDDLSDEQQVDVLGQMWGPA